MSHPDPIRALAEVAREEDARAREEERELPAVDPKKIHAWATAALEAKGGVVRPVRRRAPVVFTVAAALALAAGVVFWIGTHPRESALPTYAMTVEGADRSLRGDDAGPEAMKFAKGALVRIDLKPAQSTAAVPSAAVFLLRNGEGRAVGAKVVSAETGALRIEGTREGLFGDATGSWELVVFVGPATSLPKDVVAAREAKPNVQRLTITIELP